MRPLFIFGIFLIAIGVGGFIWRLFFASRKPKEGKDPPPGDITNLELYRLLSRDINEIKWTISFQTAILVGLLIAILVSL